VGMTFKVLLFTSTGRVPDWWMRTLRDTASPDIGEHDRKHNELLKEYNARFVCEGKDYDRYLIFDNEHDYTMMVLRFSA
jgi:hypothetical protein